MMIGFERYRVLDCREQPQQRGQRLADGIPHHGEHDLASARRLVAERPAGVVLARGDAFAAQVVVVVLGDLEIVVGNGSDLGIRLAEAFKDDLRLPCRAFRLDRRTQPGGVLPQPCRQAVRRCH